MSGAADQRKQALADSNWDGASRRARVLRWLALAAVVLHLAAVQLLPGLRSWAWGTYHFVHLNLLVVALALALARRLVPREAPLHFLSRMLVIAFGIPALVCTLLGACGLLSFVLVAMTLDIAAAGWLAVMRQEDWARFLSALRLPTSRRAEAGWVMAVLLLVAGVFVFGAWGSGYWRLPPTHWDDHTYHLAYPAHWLQVHRLETLAIPRGDPSVPFYPLNAQIMYLWAMLPFRTTDYTVRLVPIAVLGALVVHLLSAASTLGAGKAGLVAAVLVPFFPFLHGAFQRLPGILGSGGYGSDLMLAAFAAGAVAMLLRAVVHLRLGEVMCLGVALGLMVGTKFHGVLYAGILGLIFVYRVVQEVWRHPSRARRRAWCAFFVCLVAALLFGGFAYMRNLLNTGNPVYPAEVRVLGCRWFAGPRTAAIYGQHRYHSLHEYDWSIFRHYLGWFWEVEAALCLLATVLIIVRRHHVLPLAVVPLLPFIFFGTMFVISPYRWLRFGYAGAVLLPLGVAITVGVVVRTQRRCQQRGGRWQYKRARWGTVLARVLPLLLITGLCLGVIRLPELIRRYQAEKARLYEEICLWRHRIAFAEGWRVLDDLTRGHGARVACWTMNNFYPLFGSELQNDVFFVPRNRWTWATFYDLGSAVRNVSGEENYLVLGGLRPEDLPDLRAWERNLAQLGVDYLFIGPDLIEGTWPVEWQWAQVLAGEGKMTLVRQGIAYVLYRVERGQASVSFGGR